MKFLSDTKQIEGKSAFVRADLDVSLDEKGNIMETFRLDVLVPTLKFLIEMNIKPTIAGHMGRPGGVKDPVLSTTRLHPYFDAVLGSGNYLLLENLRFDPGENSKDPSFAKKIISGLAIYVNESFATCHRDTASISLIPEFLPSYAGLRLEKEIKNLEGIIKDASRPLIGLVGGVKKSKKEAIYSLAEYFDYLLVGGALKQDENDPEEANVFYPLDYVAEGLDIGPRTISNYSNILKSASTVVWAGPMGAYDKGQSKGSQKIAQAILNSSAYTIVGGGDTITCLSNLDLLDSFDFVSTGGGAMLDFLTKKRLPGLEALSYYD